MLRLTGFHTSLSRVMKDRNCQEILGQEYVSNFARMQADVGAQVGDLVRATPCLLLRRLSAGCDPASTLFSLYPAV